MKNWISYSKVNNTYLLKTKNRTVWYVKKNNTEISYSKLNMCIALIFHTYSNTGYVFFFFFAIINLQIILYVKYVSLSQ